MIKTIKKRISKKTFAILTILAVPVLAVSYQHNIFSISTIQNNITKLHSAYFLDESFSAPTVMAAALGDNLNSSLQELNQYNQDVKNSQSIGIENLTLVSHPETAKEAMKVANETTEVVSHTYDLIGPNVQLARTKSTFRSSNPGLDDGSERTYISAPLEGSVAKAIDPNAIETKLVNWFFAPKTQTLDADVRKEFSATSLRFSYLNLNHIEEHAPQAFNQYDLVSVYEQQKKIATMQKTALYISQNYEVDLNKSEKIVLEVYKHSNLQNLPPSLLFGVIDAESTFQEQAVSSKAAKGLMQVIPKYHPEEMKAISDKKLPIASVEGGIEVGAKVLRKYLDLARGNLSLALQMYNGSTTDSTKKYARKVLTNTGRFEVVAKK